MTVRSRKLSRGNTVVAAVVVVTLPFLGRSIALPVLARLWRKSRPAKTVMARELVETIAAHSRDGDPLRPHRLLIATQYQPEVPGQPSHQEIRAVHLAWANTSA